MVGRDDLLRLERAVAEAVRRGDPAVLRQRAAGLPEVLRRAAAAVDPDGLRIAALLVAQLRFQRLLHGSAAARAAWARDDAAFTAVFRRYHAEVPPAAADPRSEAVAFAAWLADETAGGRA